MTILLRSLLRKATYVCAALVIVAALIVLASRLFTPVLDQHRGEAEKWASDLLQAPVAIKNIRFAWYGYQPEIRLNEVTASSAETHLPILQIRRVSIFISIPKSIWQWKIVPAEIELSGSHLTITQNEQGAVVIKGLPFLDSMSNEPFQTETSVPKLLAWLSQQPDIILDNIKLHYRRAADPERVLTLYHLGLENRADEHTILGRAILEQSQPIAITTAIQWQGSGEDLSTIQAKAYLYVADFSLAQWLTGYEWQNWQLKNGLVNAKIWLDWSNGALQRVQTHFQGQKITLYAKQNNETHLVNRISGDIGWKHDGDNWVFAGDDILIDLPSHLWPTTHFYLSLAPDSAGHRVPAMLSTGYLNITDMEPFLFALSDAVPAAVKAALSASQLKGNIQSLAITFPPSGADWHQAAISAEVSKLSFLPWQGMPGITNLSGAINWKNNSGDIELNSERLRFDYPAVFLNQIVVDQLNGHINVLFDEKQQAWQANLATIQIVNADGAANVKGSFLFLPGKAPDINLDANFSLANARRVSRYLPLNVFSADLRKWLTESFSGGEVTSGHAAVQGNLADFPFSHGAGTFLITGDVNNIDFTFAPDWPALKHVGGKLTFSGSKMLVDVDRGQTLDIPFGRVVAEIPDIGAEGSILTVKAEPIKTDFANAMAYTHVSPLEKTIGRMFHEVSLSGPISLVLTMKIPLHTPDMAQVDGSIDIENGLLKLEPWNLAVSQLKGLVHFSETTTDAQAIQGVLFGKPLEFSLATVKKGKSDSIVRANFRNHIAITDLENWLKLPFSTVVKGDTDVAGELDLAFDQPINLRLTSQLVGVDVNLPDQYGKQAQQPIDFNALLIIDQDKPLKIQVAYGKLLNAAVVVGRDELGEMKLQGATLSFGSAAAAWPAADGLYIAGSFAALDWDAISKYYNQAGSSNLPADFLKEINVKVGKLNLISQSLTNADVDIKPGKPNWQVNVSSDQIAGQIQFPAKLTRQSTITAAIDRLDIHTASNGQSSLSVDPATLPSISVTVNSAKVNGISLGKLSIKAAPKAGGLDIQTLRLQSSNLDLQSSGEWVRQRKYDVTSLTGVAVTNSVHNLLMGMGFDAHNFVAQNGRLRFDISWEDTPYSFAFAKMNGSASLDIGKGRVVDIGEENGAKMGLGRMLSLFSLQTIPRRLSLDFSDVFQKGYSFDSFKGDFKIDDGDIYTQNLRFDGPVAKISINGRIGLSGKDYNLVLGVTPYVTSSIPVAATLLTGNPLIGLGALAVNTVVGSQVSKATTHYYAVTGSWSNPSWKTVSGP